MFKPFWERWMALAHVIGNFQSRLLLSIFYFLVLSPCGLFEHPVKGEIE